MRVLLAGATGVLGRATTRALLAAGHEVVGLSRSDANDATLRALGATPARGDLFDAASIARVAAGCEVFVRTATHIPQVKRPTPRHFVTNDRIRREGTRALLDAAKRVGARRYVQESVAWAEPDDPVTGSAVESERMAEASGVPSMTLRFGWFYSADSPQTRALADMLRARRLPVLGDGSARLAFLHVEDAARAVASAVTSDATGVFDVVDDRPTATGAFFDAFARAVGGEPPRRVPAWVGRLAAGPVVTKMLTTPMDVSNAAFRKATGWTPRYATVDEGLREVVAGL